MDRKTYSMCFGNQRYKGFEEWGEASNFDKPSARTLAIEDTRVDPRKEMLKYGELRLGLWLSKT